MGFQRGDRVAVKKDMLAQFSPADAAFLRDREGSVAAVADDVVEVDFAQRFRLGAEEIQLVAGSAEAGLRERLAAAEAALLAAVAQGTGCSAAAGGAQRHHCEFCESSWPSSAPPSHSPDCVLVVHAAAVQAARAGAPVREPAAAPGPR